MIEKIIGYFDLQSQSRKTRAFGHAGTSAPVLPQYFALAAGVVIEPFLRKYIETGHWTAALSDVIGRILFGLVIAVVLLPSVYRSSFDPAKPILVQLAALVPMGMGWQSLFNAAVNTAKQVAS